MNSLNHWSLELVTIQKREWGVTIPLYSKCYLFCLDNN